MSQQKGGSSSKPPRLTPTHRRMLKMLEDGELHSREDLFSCLDDQFNEGASTVAVHITTLRKVLRLRGEDVICECDGKKRRYRYVKLFRPNGEPLVNSQS